jgi:hypothetical protein
VIDYDYEDAFGYADDRTDAVAGAVTLEAAEDGATVAVGPFAGLLDHAGDGETDALVALGVAGNPVADTDDVGVVAGEMGEDQRLVVSEESRTEELTRPGGGGATDPIGLFLAQPDAAEHAVYSGDGEYHPVLPTAGEAVPLGEDSAWVVGGDGGGALVAGGTGVVVAANADAAETVREALPEGVDAVAEVTDRRAVLDAGDAGSVDSVAEDDPRALGVDVGGAATAVRVGAGGVSLTVDHPEHNGRLSAWLTAEGVDYAHEAERERDGSVVRTLRNVGGVDVAEARETPGDDAEDAGRSA